MFERVAKGEFNQREELVEAGGYNSDQARRSDDFAEQFEMARHAELLLEFVAPRAQGVEGLRRLRRVICHRVDSLPHRFAVVFVTGIGAERLVHVGVALRGEPCVQVVVQRRIHGEERRPRLRT